MRSFEDDILGTNISKDPKKKADRDYSFGIYYKYSRGLPEPIYGDDELFAKAGRAKGDSFVDRYTPPADDYTRELHARVFSNMAALELIAMEAAKRGDGVIGQLTDELFHRRAFKGCAEKAKALYLPDKPTKALIDFLSSLKGKDSINILNIVAEGWLSVVFGYLAKLKDFAPYVFEEIAKDEKRHSQEARLVAPELTEETESVVRKVEQLLFDIANSPFFMLPLVRLLGREDCTYMGEDLARSHEDSCRFLGITPKVSKVKALARNGRNLLRHAPTIVESRPWDNIKFRMWKSANDAAQILMEDIEIPEHVKANPVSVQLRFMRAVGVTYQQHPELLVVYRGGQLWNPQTVILGLRTTHNDRNQVGTIFFNPTKYINDKRLLSMINNRKRRMNNERYEDIPDLSSLEKYMFPSYAVATVSSNGAYGGIAGCGPLIDIEGIGTAFTIGRIRDQLYLDKEGQVKNKKVFTMTIKLDHRVADGKEIGLLSSSIKKQFERSTFK